MTSMSMNKGAGRTCYSSKFFGYPGGNVCSLAYRLYKYLTCGRIGNLKMISIKTVDNIDEIDTIDKLRHEVYAEELGQFLSNEDGVLRDRKEVESKYFVATLNEKVLGFVGVTPPTSERYSLDHYVDRETLSVHFDDHLYEIRALTVRKTSRGSSVAAALLYAAFRFIEESGGRNIIAIGHADVSAMYLKMGMCKTGCEFKYGNLNYEVLASTTVRLAKVLDTYIQKVKLLGNRIDWKLDIPFEKEGKCFHGGAFFDAIGASFKDLKKREEIINADVLDAWFPPCPEAQKAISENLEWIMRTSPPNHAEGLVQAIAKKRGVVPESILTASGSSPLIFLAFAKWLNKDSKVLLLSPSYGEYKHVLQNVVGCKVEFFSLKRDDGYIVNLQNLKVKLSEGFDMFIWVNPNSPTGKHVPLKNVEDVLSQVPIKTRVWIDETYIEYAGAEHSTETYAAASDNVVVVKSMSKVYGLSGLRVGYLCAAPNIISSLSSMMPPWSVSLPAQIAAVYALNSEDYYARKYTETHRLRTEFVEGLKELGIREIVDGVTNFIMFHLPKESRVGKDVIEACRDENLFIRDASEMGNGMGERALRVAVKDEETNKRMLEILGSAIT